MGRVPTIPELRELLTANLAAARQLRADGDGTQGPVIDDLLDKLNSVAELQALIEQTSDSV